MKPTPWILTLALFIATSGLAQPRLLIPDNEFDFGAVPQNATVVQFFWLKSVGTDTLRIREIKTGCDCTTIPLSTSEIAPGDSLRVGVYWNSERKVGLSSRHPYIWIVGQEEPERLHLKAKVAIQPENTRPVSMKPFRAEFSQLKAFSVDSVSIRLTNHSDSTLRLSIVSALSDEFRVELADSLAPRSDGQLVLRVAPDFLEQEFERSITIAFDGGSTDVRGRFTVPIRRKKIA